MEKSEYEEYLEFKEFLRLRQAANSQAVGEIASRMTREPGSREYTPDDDFDTLLYVSGDSDRASRTISRPQEFVEITDDFSHDFDAPWYQGRI